LSWIKSAKPEYAAQYRLFLSGSGGKVGPTQVVKIRSEYHPGFVWTAVGWLD
jgi:hypothetical protein